jgi:hypothetical protein
MASESEIAFARFAPPPPDAAQTTADFEFDHAVWDALLRRYTRRGERPPTGLDYAGFTLSDRNALSDYLTKLQAHGVDGQDRAGQFAFWINLYNARTVALVLDHMPVASIRNINLGGGVRAALLGGPWQAKLMRVAGISLSLDDIEHGILRRLFRDYRLHFALNCASRGCPSLQPYAFTGATLEASLQDCAQEFVNSAHGVTIEAGGLVLSSIFDWYRKDFGGSEEALLNSLVTHASPALREALRTTRRVAAYRYDWGLNDQPGGS